MVMPRLPFLLLLVLMMAWPSPLEAKREADRCAPCQTLVDSFEKEMDRTKAKNAGGGNSKWEEGRLRKWSHSELRYVEVVDSLCGGSKPEKNSANDKCRMFFGEHEEHVEEWWAREDRDQRELRQHLCVEKTQVCCPKGRFGKKCEVCPGLLEEGKPCNGHGDCDGSGTRGGKGTCSCNSGWAGPSCGECAPLYFFDEEQQSCFPCDELCKGGCTGKGPQHCLECKDGYFKAGDGNCTKCDDPCEQCLDNPRRCLKCSRGYEPQENSQECQDQNECSSSPSPCPGPHSLCINTVGSFTCECQEGFQKDHLGDCIGGGWIEQQEPERKEQWQGLEDAPREDQESRKEEQEQAEDTGKDEL